MIGVHYDALEPFIRAFRDELVPVPAYHFGLLIRLLLGYEIVITNAKERSNY